MSKRGWENIDNLKIERPGIYLNLVLKIDWIGGGWSIWGMYLLHFDNFNPSFGLGRESFLQEPLLSATNLKSAINLPKTVKN